MTHSVLLDNVNHKDLRVITQRGAAWGDGLMSAVAFPVEFRNLQAHYPIVFQKTADGISFQPVALFGFQEGENLFLGPKGWDAHHVPMAIERMPFMIGRGGDQLMVHIDMNSPRISFTEGEPVFFAHGAASEYLERITSLLLTIHEGLESTPAFIEALLAHELLESFVLDVEHFDGSTSRFAGYYTIHEERLAALDSEALGQLHRAGHLQAIYMALASVSRFRDLIERRQQRMALPTFQGAGA